MYKFYIKHYFKFSRVGVTDLSLDETKQYIVKGEGYGFTLLSERCPLDLELNFCELRPTYISLCFVHSAA